ncbi:hypothetical protein AGABI1DRAFT_79354 [Agaricus bisporus var. burnettii JB137-S8]|uniref:RBR-type E3 ubiquitin transferase n=1 Tax=Agaricus bisporus var. burnettii (strain JB137-S8 / ATCC MYA-4627 / FGSC 10392) TaxID=597362 RepID=K5WYV9_AGABU|nr:uncharacterized protein AGABI1DRAFT_79354 [Agaricus bisporus var. burnettii JB137-S8]EKM75797.1 hypothetical protein AGABI1DRAFT_79354 [Agaricus bisporus var. burnettii JB137-S8]
MTASAHPENWTDPSSSPVSGNEQLFSASSQSSTPTTASPAPSEDEREERQDPPARRNPFDSICAIYKRTGRCPIGEKCMFKHVKEMDEPPPVEAESSKGLPPTTSPVVHTTPVQDTTPPEPPTPTPSTKPTPIRPPGIQEPARHFPPNTTRICRLWLQKRCFYGHNCRYSHPDLENDGPVPPTKPKIFDSKEEFMLSFTLHDHMRVQCSAGFDIQRLQTAFESSTLLISNISTRVRANHLKEVLGSFGLVEELYMPPSFLPGSVLKVTYSDAAEAQKAQNALNGQKMFDLTLTAKIAASGTMKTVANAIMKDTSVRVTWEAPAKQVYAGYSNGADAQHALEIARSNPLNGHYLKGSIYEGMPVVDMVNVHFRGVPLDVDKADMVRFVNPVDMMWTRPSYTDAEDAEKFIKKNLWARGAPESFEILPPPYRDGGMIKAWATYPTSAKAKEAAQNLDGRKPKCLGLTVIRAKHVHTISYSLTAEKFAQLMTAIDALQESRRASTDAIVVTRRNTGGAIVRLNADGQKELAHLKHQFETIVKGEVVRCDGKVVWDSFFSRPAGYGFLRRLEAGPPFVQIVIDETRCHIRVHGFSVHRARVVGLIINKVKELRAQKKLQIPLPGRLLGAALQSATLRALRDKHGLENSQIDLEKRAMFVSGDFTLFRTFREAVDEIKRGLPADKAYNGPTCPVCFGEPSSALELRCGHTWCRDCVAHYLRSSAERRSFPVKCLGKEGRCGIKIPIAVAKEVLSTPEVMSLVESAFLSHIQSRPKEYRFCPSPDCPQVYRATSQKAALQCPSCLTSICTRCGFEAHDGFQCADQVQDELFKKWVKEHDVKHCPTCNAAIERTEGCNHMTCTRCQTHICWQCLKTFEGGQGIYGHMREVHGTFGLGQIFE